MAAYSIMARFYDEFTDDVPYRQWAEFLKQIFDRFNAAPELVLDLACGTGSLTKLLAEDGYDMIGVDMSPDMLSVAAGKTGMMEKRPMFLCQRMESLDLYGTVDAAVCALDSVNYLADLISLGAAFDRVGLFLNDGGLFVFDVNTDEKFRAMDTQVYVRESEDCFCAWQADYDEDTRIMHYLLDFFAHIGGTKYQRYTENHTERAHTREELVAALDHAQMDLLGVFGELALRDPVRDEQRVFYVARRRARQDD